MRAIFTLLFVSLFSLHGISQNLKAVNDTIHLTPGIEKTVYVLANDTIPQGDSIIVAGGQSNPYIECTWHSNGFYTYLSHFSDTAGPYSIPYYIMDVTTGKSSSADVILINDNHSYGYLDINNINALFNAFGNHFWTRVIDRGFQVPKGGCKGTISSSSLWIGGKTEDSSLCLAAEMYRTGSTPGLPWGGHPDFYAGPVMDSSRYSIYQDTVWNYIWNLKRTEIEYHIAHWNDVGYQPVHDIQTWPGNGNVSYGQAPQLAPFHDRNGDGIYNPMDGDYPSIRGDQCLYFIFNDDRGNHLETGGSKMKVEIHGMAYAFDLPSDSAFKNTVFLNYRIINRSLKTYYHTLLGIFTDLDIGWFFDDFIGCDIYRGSYFGYNARPVDGFGQPCDYGANPPAQAVTFLAGPSLEPLGTDRPKLDNMGHQLCNESINGYGFGDGIPDNERLGMYSFVTFNTGDWASYNNIPANARQYYQYMRSAWPDTTPVSYGGNGHSGTGAYGPACRYMYPGGSDTLNWGLGCQQPNGAVDWTEWTAHNMLGDRKGFAGCGPFTFHPGDTEELDIAYIYARDTTDQDTMPSVKKLRQMIDIVRNSFKTNTLPGGGSFLGVPENRITSSSSVNVYPNPAHERITIDFGLSLLSECNFRIINSCGKEERTGIFNKGTRSISLDLSGFPSGLYLIYFSGNDFQASRKICIIR